MRHALNQKACHEAISFFHFAKRSAIMKNAFKALIYSVVFTFSISATLAMNWEGHDDWLDTQSHGIKLRDQLPKPLDSDYPSCDEMQARVKDNPYEQRPLPGKNCLETDATGEEP